MPVKYGNYKTAINKSQVKMSSSESEMEYNTRQVLASGGVVNKSLRLDLENPGTGPELKWRQNESGPGDYDVGGDLS